jgi:transposase
LAGVFTGCKNPVDTVTVESILTEGVPQLPDLNDLRHAEKDALIRALWQRLEAAERRIAELEERLGEPSKTPDNSSLPPSKGQKPNKPEKGKRVGPRQGSLGRKGGGRPLACDPDETVTAKPVACAHCQFTLSAADQVLHGRYDKIDLPVVRAAAASPWRRYRLVWRTARRSA